MFFLLRLIFFYIETVILRLYMHEIDGNMQEIKRKNVKFLAKWLNIHFAVLTYRFPCAIIPSI